jgi:hypothetical protein
LSHYLQKLQRTRTIIKSNSLSDIQY